MAVAMKTPDGRPAARVASLTVRAEGPADLRLPPNVFDGPARSTERSGRCSSGYRGFSAAERGRPRGQYQKGNMRRRPAYPEHSKPNVRAGRRSPLTRSDG